MEATRMPSTFEKTKLKIKAHSCRNCRDFSTTNQQIVLGIPIIFLFNSPIWPVEKTLILENNSGLFKLIQVVPPITDAAPDVVSLLNQTNISPYI